MMLIINILLRLVILTIILLLGLSNKEQLLVDGRFYSNVMLLFSFFIAMILGIKYSIIKKCVMDKSKFKYVYAILVIIIFFAGINLFYKFIPEFIEPKEWYETEAPEDFAYLPLFDKDINILKMTVTEGIFAMILVGLAIAREKIKNNKVKYILERALKICFRFNIVIVFFLCIFTISSKYLRVAFVKNIGLATIILASLIFAIKYYLVIKNCTKKNKEKYGKENLIIVITTNNIQFSLLDDYINPLHKFYKYATKSLVRTAVISGKTHTFITYDAVRYNLINIEEYKKIGYLFYITQNIMQLGEQVENKSIDNLEKMIDEVSKSKKNFVVYADKLTETSMKSSLKEIKEKYKFRYKNKLNEKNILDMTSLEDDEEKLKSNCQKVLDYIKEKESKDDEKNIYIKYALNKILDSFNYIEYFYNLLKISEYIIHYMAIKSMIDNPERIKKKVSHKDIKEGNPKGWRDCIELNKKYSINNKEKIKGIVSENDLVKSINRIKQRVNKNSEKTECGFKEELCTTVADVRNNFVAHGVITYDISKEFVEDLFNVTCMLIIEFEELNITIKEDQMIKEIFAKEILATYKEDERLFLYYFAKENKKEDEKTKEITEVEVYPEYINYETGKRKIIDESAKLQMDLVHSIAEIEKALGRWCPYKNETKNNKS